MTDKEVQEYFTKHYGENICGRFKNSQLETIVVNISHITFTKQKPQWQKFLIVCLIIFGAAVFPFNTSVAGIPSIQYLQEQQKKVTPKKIKKKARFTKKYKLPLEVFADLKEITSCTLGFTVVERVPDPLIFPFDTNLVKAIKNVSVNLGAPQKNDNNEKQPSPIPQSSAEFILPAALSKRRSAKKRR